MARGDRRSHSLGRPREPWGRTRAPCGSVRPDRFTILTSFERIPRVGSLSPPGVMIVTWLILPVVICLSQRLSHACLSISNYTVKLRMAHYISYRLFDSTLLHGITVVILELIHAKNLDFGRGVFIR